MTGIYKITSPTGKIYIGQSIDILNRWKKNYININCKGQPRLYNSLNKHGYINHNKEVITECSINDLDKLEILYKKFYLSKYGWNKMLFCRLYDTGGGPLSEETKQKIGKIHKGKKVSDKTKMLISSKNKGMKYSEEIKEKMRKPRKSKWVKQTLLDKNQVEDIRNKFKKGLTKSELSREYSVSWGTIKNVVAGINSYKNF